MLIKKKIINYSRQNISKSDLKAVKDVLVSDYLTQGPKVKEFEKKISNFCKVPFAVACNSATSALHIACKGLNLQKNDIVWTNPISFVASANCALYCGAKIEYVDIDLRTFNITFDALKNKIIKTPKSKLPKILITVDYAGFPCDSDKIYELAKKYKIKIIQDASHSLGAKYKHSMVGSCKYSDVTVFSFHPAKIITTGEGGVATTRNKKIFEIMQMYRTHGITKNSKFFKNKKINKRWYFEQQFLGFNYRMNDIEAALGISQLKNIKYNLSYRFTLAKKYRKELKKNLDFIKFSKVVKGSYHLFPIIVDRKKTGISRDALFKYLEKKNIYCQIHYIPIFEHPYHKISNRLKKKLYPNSLHFYSKVMSIPMYYGLKNHEQSYIIRTINEKLIKHEN